VDISFHHDGKQCRVDAAAPLEQRRKKRSRAQLRDLQVEVPSRGAQRPGSDAVAVGGEVAGAFEWGGADERVASASISS